LNLKKITLTIRIPVVKESFMAAGTHDMICDAGATFEKVIQITDSEGENVNITGYSARMQVRPSAASSTVLTELTTANTKISIDGANGKLTLAVPASETATFKAGNYVYDLETVNGSTVERILQGAFVVRAEVTR